MKRHTRLIGGVYTLSRDEALIARVLLVKRHEHDGFWIDAPKDTHHD